jgi:hypothetical protein
MQPKILANLVEFLNDWLDRVTEDEGDSGVTTTRNTALHMANAAAAVLDAMNETFAEHAEHEGV